MLVLNASIASTEVASTYYIDSKASVFLMPSVTISSSSKELSPIVLQDIPFEKRVLHRKQPLELVPTPSESGEYVQVAIPELGIEAMACTRAELIDELEETLIFLWEEYVLDDSDRFTVGAKRLKHQLMKDFEWQDNTS